jgi:uncharacterized protein YcbK (DUF882 family)
MPITQPKQVFEMIRNNQIPQIMKLNVSRYFSWGEVFTKASTSDIKLFAKLEHLVNAKKLAVEVEKRIRIPLNEPIIVNSWWRSPTRNEQVGGAENSQHLLGKAMDIRCLHITPKKVQAFITDSWPGGLGYGKTFTHVDIRARKARFTY